MDLSDDFRDGFVNSLRLDTPDQTRMAAARADRIERQLHRVPQRRLHRLRALQGRSQEAAALAGQGARGSSTTQGEKMIYFEDARLEFFGKPVAYMPYFSAPDPTVKRKTGFLMPLADQQLDQRLRRRGAVLLGAGARLRLHLLAAHHDQAGPAAARRIPPAADGRRLLDPRQRHLPARQGRLPARRRHRHAGLPRLPRQHRDHRPVRAEQQMDLGLGRHRADRPDVLPGLRPDDLSARLQRPASTA